LHQLSSEAEQGEVTFPRLKGDRRSSWYDYSCSEGRGFPAAVYEEGPAYPNALRHWSTAAQKPVAVITIMPNE
jgi:hypothetical protein